MKCIRIATCLLLAAVGCAGKPRTEPPLNVSPLQMSADEWRVVDQVFVVTDASGTMYMEENFPQAKSLSRSFVAAMPEADVRAWRPGGYKASSIGFGGEDRVAAPLAPFDRGTLARTTESLELLGSLDGLGGMTPLHDIFVEIEEVIVPGAGPAAVVLFSDGVPDEPELATWAAYRVVASHPEGVCFHTVQTGGDEDGAAFLRGISELTNCGSSRNAADVNNVAALTSFSRRVFAGRYDAPAVAAGPCAGVVRLRGIEFGFDSDQVTEGSRVVLDAAVTHLKQCPKIRVNIEGHTDGVGPESYNQGLSERRARATRDFFVGSGVDADRLSARGLGEMDPITGNDTREGRAQNRRVELKPE